MKIIYLISCCKEKLSYSAKAKDLYQSEGFKKRLSEAFSHNPDEILILSAKHHIVELDHVLEPYDVCLSNQTVGEQKKWAEICLADLSSRFNLKEDRFIILANEDYYRYLIGQYRIENYETPSEQEQLHTISGNTNLSIIHNFLSKSGKPYCDDCLSLLTGIKPRQQINQICNRNTNVICRNDYERCSNCNKYKIVRTLNKKFQKMETF